ITRQQPVKRQSNFARADEEVLKIIKISILEAAYLSTLSAL
ncbi:15530_t:CDS:1, partial [Gigaspora rosea]